VADLVWNALAVKEIIGVVPTAFRPPRRPNDNLILVMSVDDRVRSVVQALGLKLVLWNVDTNDWQTGGLSPQNQISSITLPVRTCITGCPTKNPNQGGIVLEHDFPSALAIPNVLDLMTNTNLNLKTVSQCTGYNAYNGDWLDRVMGKIAPITIANPTLDSKGNL
jgi:peptidoglycan/xylan/chitin deacetylase (PgdA/CDA1 family)